MKRKISVPSLFWGNRHLAIALAKLVDTNMAANEPTIMGDLQAQVEARALQIESGYALTGNVVRVVVGADDPRRATGYGRNTTEMCSLIIRTAVVGMCVELIVFGFPDFTTEYGGGQGPPDDGSNDSTNIPRYMGVLFEIFHLLVTVALCTMLYSMDDKLRWRLRDAKGNAPAAAVYSVMGSSLKISVWSNGFLSYEAMPTWLVGLLWLADYFFYLVICIYQCKEIRGDRLQRDDPQDMLDMYFLPWDGKIPFPCGMPFAWSGRRTVLPSQYVTAERDYWAEQAARDEGQGQGLQATSAHAAYAPELTVADARLMSD